MSPHKTPISRKAKMFRGLMFGCKVRIQCSRCRVETLLSFYQMNQRTSKRSIRYSTLVSIMRLSFNSSLPQALDLLSVLNEVFDMDDAHRVDASQLIDFAVMCLENCRQRTYRLGVVKLLQKPINPSCGIFIETHQRTIPNRQHHNTPIGGVYVVLPRME